MKNNFILGGLFALALFMTATSVSAQRLMAEDFSYSTGQLTTVSAGSWVNFSGTGNFIQVSGGSLSYSGYPASGIGNKIDIISVGTSAEDAYRAFPTQGVGTTTYAAFLVNVANTTGLALNSSTTGDYFAGFLPSASTTALVGRISIRLGSTAGTYQLGLRASSSNAAAVFSTTDLTPGTTYLIILSSQVIAGETNDVYNLWVNPTLGGAPPAPTVTQTSGLTTDNIDNTRFFVRQGTTTTPNASIDGIRVGTTWASLTAPAHTNVDMNGDGKTDWVVVRGTGSALSEMVKSGAYPVKGFASVRERMKFQAANLNLLSAPSSLPMYWYTLINTTNEVQISQWGDALTDTLVPEDYDGDGKDDIAIWRPSADGAAFYIFQSATSTLRIEPFGHIGHDPTVVGDYDGDGKADPAVYECPPVGSPAGPCYFWYRSSLNPVGYYAVQWGTGNVGDNLPDPGDFDGDGKYDYCVQRQLPGGSPGQAQFALYNSGGTVELLGWGLTSDTVVPGDYDGDGKSDIMVVRAANNALTWYGYIRTTGGVTVANWGNPSVDTIAPGDYDGDGKTDYAIYRAATAPNPNTFWAYNSSNGAVQGVNWGSCQSGLPCDIPAANWYVH